MPMRRNLGPVNAPDAHHEWRSFGGWVPCHRRKIAALHDRRPLQIAEVHNFRRRGAVFFLLAVNRRRKHGRTDQRDAHTSRSNLFHATLLWKKDRALNWPKDTPPMRGRQHQSISRTRIEPSPRRHGQPHPRAANQRQQRFAHDRQPLTFGKNTNAPYEDYFTISSRGAFFNVWKALCLTRRLPRRLFYFLLCELRVRSLPRLGRGELCVKFASSYFFGKFGSAFTSLICFVCRSL